jgi:Mannosyl-glycoprotein endo-beta-N-acetylglucosaminidase
VPVLSAAELTGWFASTGHRANTTVPISQLASDYETAAGQTGVRGDIAFAQSVVETGFFSFPAYGQITPADNNFAGIGACDSCAHGWSFPTARIGVSAQLQLLDAYASRTQVPTPLVGRVGVGGCCGTWLALSGTWATNPGYGVAILTVYRQMLEWALPRALAAARLGPRAKP